MLAGNSEELLELNCLCGVDCKGRIPHRSLQCLLAHQQVFLMGGGKVAETLCTVAVDVRGTHLKQDVAVRLGDNSLAQ